MQFVEPVVTPIATGEGTPQELTKVIEQAYRICYKSEAHMKEGSESLITRLLYGGEKGKMIHTSPLEHRRVTFAVDDWVVDAVADWQDERGTAFISIIPQKTPSAEEHQWLLEGDLRAFFDFVKGYETDEDDIKGDYGRRDEARLVINDELHRNLPVIFKHMEPYDDTDNAIDWEGCHIIGESTDYMSFHVVTSRDVLQEVARNRTISPNVESTRYCNYSKRGVSFCIPMGYEWSEGMVEAAAQDPSLIDQSADRILNPYTVVDRTYGKCETKIDSDGTTKLVITETKDHDAYLKEGYQILSETRMADPVSFDQIVYNLDSMPEIYSVAAKVAEMLYNKAIALGVKPQEARGLLPGCLKTEMILTGRLQDWAHFLKLRNDPTADPQMQYIAKQIEEWFVANGHEDIRAYDLY